MNSLNIRKYTVLQHITQRGTKCVLAIVTKIKDVCKKRKKMLILKNGLSVMWKTSGQIM